MRTNLFFSFTILGGLSVAYGCHTIAGVRTDGVLATEDAGTSTSGSGGAAGAGGNGGMGGMAGAGGIAGMGGAGNCDPADCVSKQCDKDACVPVNAACMESGVLLTLFAGSDFVQPDPKMLVGYSSKAAYVAIADESGPNPTFRVRSIDGAGKVAPIVDCTLSTSGANMVTARTSDTEFVLQGHINGSMAEISFPTNDPDGKITGPCVEKLMPSWPECVNRIENETFVRNGNATKYATTCRDAVDSTVWHLVTGGSDESTYTTIASGPNTDVSLRVAGIGIIKNERVIFTGPELVGEFFHRRESMGYAPQIIDFSGDPARQEAVLSVTEEVEGQSAFVIGASALLPPQFDASLLGGVLTDMNQFATKPTTDFREFVHLTGADVAKLGTVGQVAKDDNSYYAAIVPLAKKSVEMYWFTKKGETLIGGKTAYTVPAGNPETITRVAFVPLTFQRLLVWREENAGVLTVRAQRFVCFY
jgi:hypothetical protein